MDRPLDDRIAERQPRGRGPPPPRHPRPTYPRDGVRKNRRDDRQDLDNDWVHDRYDDDASPRDGYSSRQRGSRRDDYEDRRSPERERERVAPPPAKIRIDNLHYDLSQEDVAGLFARIAPVREARLTYDRAGRSDGTAFVTYDHISDARAAVREFDGANAKGQPIRLTILPLPPKVSSAPVSSRRDNPFDRVENPKSLFDRIDPPSSRDRDYSSGRGRDRRRTESPMEEIDRDAGRNGSRRGPRRGAGPRDRRTDTTRPAPDNIDRYTPGSGRGGRRPGERRERGTPREGTPRSGARPKKTAEELDAEMDDYWGKDGAADATNGAAAKTTETPAAATNDDDIDMIE